MKTARQHNSGLAAVLLLLSFIITTTTQAEVLNTKQAINEAGRQRMLTQRMVKAYFLIDAELASAEQNQHLYNAISSFDQNIDRLIAFAPNANIRTSIDSVDRVWHTFKPLLQNDKPLDKLSAQNLLKTAELLHKHCQVLVDQIVRRDASDQATLVALSGRQRYLSQRLAAIYTTMFWGISNEQLEQEFAQAQAEFGENLAILLAAPINNAEIQQALSEVDMKWKFSRAGINKHTRGKYYPRTINRTTEQMLISMNRITSLYEKL